METSGRTITMLLEGKIAKLGDEVKRGDQNLENTIKGITGRMSVANQNQAPPRMARAAEEDGVKKP